MFSKIKESDRNISKYFPIFIIFSVIAAFIAFDENSKPLDDQDEIKLQHIEIEKEAGSGYGEDGGEFEDNVSV